MDSRSDVVDENIILEKVDTRRKEMETNLRPSYGILKPLELHGDLYITATT